MTPTNQNFMHAKIKSRLNSGTSCYHLPQNHLPIHLKSRNIKTKVYINIILPAAVHGCESCSLTLREKYRLRVFNNTVLR